MQLSLPELPSYSDILHATTIHATQGPDSSTLDVEERASSRIEAADEAIKVARKEWDAISKLGAETARCGNCEEWWRTSVKDVVRACIACSIAIATVKKGLGNAQPENIASTLQADKAEEGKGYHDFWIVPRVRLT